GLGRGRHETRGHPEDVAGPRDPQPAAWVPPLPPDRPGRREEDRRPRADLGGVAAWEQPGGRRRPRALPRAHTAVVLRPQGSRDPQSRQLPRRGRQPDRRGDPDRAAARRPRLLPGPLPPLEPRPGRATAERRADRHPNPLVPVRRSLPRGSDLTAIT